MSTIMKRAIVSEDAITMIDVAKPVPSDDEVLVETTVSGVCGSDTHAAAGLHPFIDLPYYPGHEVVGIVREVGHDVHGVAVGMHVTVEPTLPCGECKMCRTDRSNICENLRFFGCGHSQGGMAEFFTVSANRVHVLPEGMSDLQGVLIEPLATPVHAVRLSGDISGKAAIIIGAGTIGLLTLAAARHAGARRIVMTDVRQDKLVRALALGADAVVDATESDAVERMHAQLGESADVVFDCVSIQSTIDQAISLAMKAGTVVVVGVPARPVAIPLPEIQDRQIRIQGSATYMPEDFAVATEIIRTGGVRVDNFITGRYLLADIADAFAAAVNGGNVKVVVHRGGLT